MQCALSSAQNGEDMKEVDDTSLVLTVSDLLRRRCSYKLLYLSLFQRWAWPSFFNLCFLSKQVFGYHYATLDQLECTDPARNDFLEPAGDSTDLVHCKGRPRG